MITPGTLVSLSAGVLRSSVEQFGTGPLVKMCGDTMGITPGTRATVIAIAKGVIELTTMRDGGSGRMADLVCVWIPSRGFAWLPLDNSLIHEVNDE